MIAKSWIRLALPLLAASALSLTVALVGQADEKPATATKPILAGFAERDITPAIGMERPGGYGKVYHRSFHDPCKVRVSLFDDGNKTVALIGIDALFIYRDLVQRARQRIEKETGIPGGHIMVSASHTHSAGPVGMVQPGEYDFADDLVKDIAYNQSSAADPGYLQIVENAIVEGVKWAHQHRVPAKLGFGSGHEDSVSFNRRLRMKNGQSWSHPGAGNPDIVDYAAPIDPEVGVVAVWDQHDELIGTIVNYACHCTTSPTGGGISASWVHHMEEVIQGGLRSRAPVVFLQGACGDITQVDNLAKVRPLQGTDMSRLVGGRIGAEAIKVVFGMAKTEEARVDVKSRIWPIKRRVPSAENVEKAMQIVQGKAEADPTTKIFAKETVMIAALAKHQPEAEVEVQPIQVGPAVFVSNPAEYFVENGLRIKKESPFPFTWPVELANGCVGYVPTEEAFSASGGGYETRLTSYSNLEITAGTQMADTGIQLAKEMAPDAAPQHPALPEFKAPWAYGNVGPELK
ncbi:MAG TPA: hypothetical protein PLA50_07040 [Bacteroidia bacterium]|nr:hypothetical protein [Bacteroidia bacterium]